MECSVEKKIRALKKSQNILAPVIAGLFLIAIFLTLILVAGNINAVINGFISKAPVYHQEISIITNTSIEVPITLENHPKNFELNSFKISGKIKGAGIIKVYLENSNGKRLLVLDSDEFDPLTGKVIEEILDGELPAEELPSENISFDQPIEEIPSENAGDTNPIELQENETMPEVIPEDIMPIEENLTIPAENITLPEKNDVSNKTQEIIDRIINEPFSFSSAGIETKEIKESGFNRDLKLIINIEGDSEIKIEKFDYSLTDLSLLAIKEANIDSEIYNQLAEKGNAKIIVNLKDTGGKGIQEVSERKAKVLSSLNTKKIENGGEFEVTHEYKKLNAISGEASAEGIAKLLEDPNVKSIELDRVLQIQLSGSVPLINATSTWGKQANGINITGAGETACVLDTGINKTHPALVGKVINETCYCSVSGPCCPNGNYTDSSALDDHSHGTHVAGIISSIDSTYKGVAPDSKLVSVKVCNSAGSCGSSDIIAGIEYCTDNSELYNISVISISIGGGSYTDYCDSLSQSMTDAINAAVAKGIMVSIAAGNDGYSSSVGWPACVRNATTVAATTKTDDIWSSSNRNSLVDLAAPGASITSSGLSGFVIKSGTSMATPHVSGSYLLVRQYYKLYNNANPSIKEIEDILKNTGKQVYDSSSGLNYSRIDILSAINSIYKINQAENSIESPSKAKIVFSTSTNLDSSTSAFTIRNNFVELNPGYSQFNKPANITFYSLNFTKGPIILRDGGICADCAVNSYSNGNLSFYVPHFTNYTAGSNSELNIWDSGGSINETIIFYANYTNRTSAMPILGASCKINFSSFDTNMNYASGLFEYSRNFSSYGNYSYNVICNQTDFEALSLSDTVLIGKITPEINLKLNGISSNLTVKNNTAVNISAESIIPADGNLKLYLNNNLINSGISVSNITNFTSYGAFNITAYFNETEVYSEKALTLWVNVINDINPPIWSSNKSSPISGSDYSLGQQYQFNITWADNIGISSVWIEHNFTGNMLNYSVLNSGNEYYYNWAGLKAGNYSYRFYANDTSNNINSTPLTKYNVDKRTGHLHLIIDDGNENRASVTVYDSPIHIDAEMITPDSGEIILKYDGLTIREDDSPISMNKDITQGSHKINASYSGNENYTYYEYTTTVTADLEDVIVPAGSGSSSTPGLSIQCTESWSCTAWNDCINGIQTRTCTDSNHCGTSRIKPAESQSCIICNPNWNCTEWGDCFEGNETRNCTDLNNCNSTAEMPALTQECGLLPAMEDIKDAVSISAAKILLRFEESFDFLKEKPIYIAPAILSILSLLLIIKFSAPAIRFLRCFRIKITRVNLPKTKAKK